MKTRIILSLILGLLFLNGAFAQVLNFTYPTGGETLKSYNLVRIQWTLPNPNIIPYGIALSLDGGVTYPYFNSVSETTYYDMLIPNCSSNNCMLMVYSLPIGGGQEYTTTSALFTIAPFPAPSLTVNLTADTTVCARTSLQLAPQISGGQPPYKLLWMGGQFPQPFQFLCDSCDTLNSYAQLYAFSTGYDSSYFVTVAVTDANGLTGYDSISIHLHPAAVFSNSVSNWANEPCGTTYPVNLSWTGGAQVTSYQWRSVPNGNVLSDSLSLVLHVPPGSSEYMLFATDQYGCTLSYDTLEFNSSCNTLPVLASNDCYQLGTPDSTVAGFAYFSLHILDNDVYDTTGNNYHFQLTTPPTVDSLSVIAWYSYFGSLYPNYFVLAVPVASLATPDSFQYTLYDYPSPNLSSSAWVRINVSCPVDSGLVWPGDADNNGYADNADLLPIGIGYGTSGVVRPGANISWTGQYCADWSDSLATGTNYKYIDCDGNGIINADDTMAIHQNFFMVHPRGSAQSYRSGAPVLAIEILQDTVGNADTLHTLIMLGDSAIPATGVYGVAFDINIDPLVADTNYMSVHYTNSWLGTTNQLLSMSRYFGTQGVIKTAVTRYDHAGRSGYGPIATADFLITTSNINGKNLAYYRALLSTASITMLDSIGTPLDINASQNSTEVAFYPNSAAVQQVDQNNVVSIFPNPASNLVMITSNHAPIDYIRISDMVGQEIISSFPAGNYAQTDVSTLANGIYIVQVKTGNSKLSRLIAINR